MCWRYATLHINIAAVHAAAVGLCAERQLEMFNELSTVSLADGQGSKHRQLTPYMSFISSQVQDQDIYIERSVGFDAYTAYSLPNPPGVTPLAKRVNQLSTASRLDAFELQLSAGCPSPSPVSVSCARILAGRLTKILPQATYIGGTLHGSRSLAGSLQSNS